MAGTSGEHLFLAPTRTCWDRLSMWSLSEKQIVADHSALTVPSRLPARYLCGEMDRGANARIGRASTEVASSRDRYPGRSVLGAGSEAMRRRHDHAGLAIAALGNVEFDPGLLYRMICHCGIAPSIVVTCLPRHAVDRHDAGPHSRTVEVHGAGAASPDAAAELASCQTADVRARPTATGRHPDRQIRPVCH